MSQLGNLHPYKEEEPQSKHKTIFGSILKFSRKCKPKAHISPFKIHVEQNLFKKPNETQTNDKNLYGDIFTTHHIDEA